MEISVARPSVSPKQRTNTSLQVALTAARAAEDNRGRDIVILDLRELTPIFDYFVIATGSSRRQLHAMSEEIDNALENGLGDKRLSIEGYQASRWILLDYGDVVVHLFDEETRDYYALEQLWCEAKRVPFEPRAKLNVVEELAARSGTGVSPVKSTGETPVPLV